MTDYSRLLSSLVYIVEAAEGDLREKAVEVLNLVLRVIEREARIELGG